MKKIMLTLVFILTLTMAACQTASPPATAVHPSIEVEPPAASAVHPSIEVNPPSLDSQIPQMVAGGAIYRGNITAIELDGETILTLEQVKGTNFGYPSVSVKLTDKTNLIPAEINLIVGMYVEVQYGAPVDGQPLEEPVEAISLKMLMSAEALVFNGEVISINPGEKPDTGTLTLRRLESDSDDWIYRYNEETSIYLNLDELKVGDRLNVFTNGLMNPSFPPQATAVELRSYYEG